MVNYMSDTSNENFPPNFDQKPRFFDRSADENRCASAARAEGDGPESE
jgi:hypothetical protein